MSEFYVPTYSQTIASLIFPGKPLMLGIKDSILVVAGTGAKGINATFANQYFAGGSGFPDFMIFTLAMLNKGDSQIKLAGFFDNDWRLTPGEAEQP